MRYEYFVYFVYLILSFSYSMLHFVHVALQAEPSVVKIMYLQVLCCLHNVDFALQAEPSVDILRYLLCCLHNVHVALQTEPSVVKLKYLLCCLHNVHVAQSFRQLLFPIVCVGSNVATNRKIRTRHGTALMQSARERI